MRAEGEYKSDSAAVGFGASRWRDAAAGGISYEGVPGLVESKEAYGETTLIVDPARLIDACLYLRDQLDFRFLADLTPTDYLGWNERPTAGYIGTAWGRDLNAPGSAGLARKPSQRPKRFAMNYHLLRLERGAPRVRVQAWLDEDEPIASVVPVWPAADWFEREAFDMMGIRIEGHPNLTRILMPDDWEGYPLRKDYPIGGEPVRFSGEE